MTFKLVFAQSMIPDLWQVYLVDQLGQTYPAAVNGFDYDPTPITTGAYDFICEYYIATNEQGVAIRELTRILYFVSPMFVNNGVAELGTLFISAKYINCLILPIAAMDALVNHNEVRNMALVAAQLNIENFKPYGWPSVALLDHALKQTTPMIQQIQPIIKVTEPVKVEENSTKEKIEELLVCVKKIIPQENYAKFDDEIEKLQSEVLELKKKNEIEKLKNEMIELKAKVEAAPIPEPIVEIKEPVIPVPKKIKPVIQTPQPSITDKILTWGFSGANAIRKNIQQVYDGAQNICQQNSSKIITAGTLSAINWSIMRAAEYNELIDRQQLWDYPRSRVTTGAINTAFTMFCASAGYLYLKWKVTQPRQSTIAKAVLKSRGTGYHLSN